MNSEIEAKLRRSVNFPSPPGVATHIIELAQDPEIEMGKVAKALSMDSALSSKVLRIANSPLYAQRRKSENLRQALVVLGLNATLTLALSFSLVKSLRGAKAQRTELQAVLAACAACRNRRARARRCHASNPRRGNFPGSAAAGRRHAGARPSHSGFVSRRRETAARPCGARRTRKEAGASRPCPRGRVADAHLEFAGAFVSRHRAQPPSGIELQRSTRRASSTAASRSQDLSPICSCWIRSSGNLPRRRCAPSAAWGSIAWHSDRCSVPSVR